MAEVVSIDNTTTKSDEIFCQHLQVTYDSDSAFL